MLKINFNFFRKIFRHRSFASFSSRAQYSWAILLLFFLLVNLGGIIFSVNLYLQIDKGKIFLSEESLGKEVKFNKIERGELLGIINNYQKRAEKFKENEGEKNNIIDPAL